MAQDCFSWVHDTVGRDILAGVSITKNTGCIVRRCFACGNLTASVGTCDQAIAGISTMISDPGSYPSITQDCIAAQDSIYNRRGASYAFRVSRNGGVNNYANETMLVNGSTVTGTANSNHGEAGSVGSYMMNCSLWRIADWNNNNGRYRRIINR